MYTIAKFVKEYPTDDVCLDKLFHIQYAQLKGCPACGVENAEYKRIKTRRCYQCVECGHQLYPTAGTVFEKTTTPLRFWFYAMYMMVVTRNGVSAKEIERALGVTYKTAWRMAHKIREMMCNRPIHLLKGDVMVDETALGGADRFRHKDKKKKTIGFDGKTVIMAMIEDKKKVISLQISDKANQDDFKAIITEHIDKSSVLISDGHGGYRKVGKEYSKHEVVSHEKNEYVNKNGYSTNAVENYWSTFKRMVKGTHIHISEKHLSKYLAENTFRYENRERPDEMFEIMLSQLV